MGALVTVISAFVFYLMGKKAEENGEKGNKLKGCVRKNETTVDVVQIWARQCRD